MRRRAFIKRASGLLVPAAFPAIVRGQIFGARTDLPFTAQAKGSSGLNTGLVAYFRLEEAANNYRLDSTSNHNDFNTAFYAAPNVAGGVCGNAASSNAGADSIYQIRAATAWYQVNAGDSFSVSAWINFQAIPASGYHGVITCWDTSKISYFIWFTNTDPGNLKYTVSNAAGTQQADQNIVNSPSTAVWHHLAYGYDNSAGQTWFQWDNGTRTTQTVSGIYSSGGSQQSFYLFSYASDNGPVNAYIDELGWWRRVLTTSDVSLLYGGGSGLCWPFT